MGSPDLLWQPTGYKQIYATPYYWPQEIPVSVEKEMRIYPAHKTFMDQLHFTQMYKVF